MKGTPRLAYHIPQTCSRKMGISHKKLIHLKQPPPSSAAWNQGRGLQLTSSSSRMVTHLLPLQNVSKELRSDLRAGQRLLHRDFRYIAYPEVPICPAIFWAEKPSKTRPKLQSKQGSFWVPGICLDRYQSSIRNKWIFKTTSIDTSISGLRVEMIFYPCIG